MHKLPEHMEQRFQQPLNWRWHHFTRTNYKIRFGTVSPKDSIPNAVVVCLQGVRECSEKYFEIAHWCLENNLAFWTFDWRGQGGSDRYLKNPQKRHGQNFKEDIEDLHFFILQYIKHASVHPDRGRIPMAMLAHSMGGNLGLRFLKEYPDMFECAAVTAPMVQIQATKCLPNPIATTISAALKTIVGKSYVFGGGDWGRRKDHIKLSDDPIRGAVQNTLYEHIPELRSGDVTYGWVYHALQSCIKLQNPQYYEGITTPCLFGIPGNEKLVDPQSALDLAQSLPHARVAQYPDAYHELLMEKDEYRNDFLKQFYSLIKETIIERPETLKPF